MELIIQSQLLQSTPDQHQQAWFLDLKDGNNLHSLCSGTYDFCVEQKELWAKQLGLDGGEMHLRLRAAGLR